MKISKARATTADDADENTRLQAFEKEFELHWAPIYRLLRRMVGDPAEAEDLALEAMYRLYQRRPDGESDVNIGGWLYRVATNLGLHSIRSFRRRQWHEITAGKGFFEETPEDRPAEVVASEDERRTVRTVLAEMNARQAQLLVLRYSGMAYKDIAAALNLSPSSIGPLLVRAEREFEKLYRALAQEDL
ncbi:MAG TPA: sigma-70 family RNA polymerase sigma factor [Anaerolineales bacterium]